MARTALHRFLALALGIATGGWLWWVDTHPGIAAAASGSVLVLGLVASGLIRRHPEYTSASGDWRDNRWGAAGQLFLTLVAFQAVFAAPVELPDEVGLLVVIMAAYLMGYFLGGLDALEHSDRDAAREGSAGAVDPADD
ncbi:hypothetical protein [Halosimplex pelagicum]|uniref:B30.2/SPRY domain-containing protein n=1 Tax=Halosimplex pelagicum TaxID=869886 RepID=A0A7D5P7M3_9EURY|nr:hypothetical protein [Halosimplex pelagicum]QLH80564.1 hypothetical protein HZS54_02465 [Halosimplex pelagicum]